MRTEGVHRDRDMSGVRVGKVRCLGEAVLRCGVHLGLRLFITYISYTHEKEKMMYDV